MHLDYIKIKIKAKIKRKSLSNIQNFHKNEKKNLKFASIKYYFGFKNKKADKFFCKLNFF